MNKMPVLFVGHGSPMNAIEDNEFVRKWKEIASKIGKPKAILAISAHWVTSKTKVSDAEKPKTIYDMYGFPDELYNIAYKALGSKELALEIVDILKPNIQIDNTWGIDHGTWSVLCNLYNDPSIKVVQLGINYYLSPKEHYKIGQALKVLREHGVLILGSGNVVHNLQNLNYNIDGGYDYADKFDNYIRDRIINQDHESVINYKSVGRIAEESFYTAEHFYPLLYVLGATSKNDKLTVFNDSRIYGSLSMTGYLFEDGGKDE